MCLPVSRLFWVSSLAYPNLLGTKGYVVVVSKEDVERTHLPSTGSEVPSTVRTNIGGLRKDI
jgi:hypothetical protein